MAPFGSKRRRAAAVLLALSGLAPAVAADPPAAPPPVLPPPTPLPCQSMPCPAATPTPSAPAPCAPCAPGATERVNVPPPRIVVNVPPPEVVFQDVGPSCRTHCLHPKWSLFHRGSCHTGTSTQSTVQTHIAGLAQLQSFTAGPSVALLNGGGLTFGTANVGGLFATGNPSVVTTGLQQSQSISGLQAIHQAEAYAASVAATRAQQDAELRVMMAALDRAKTSMSAMSSTTQNGTASATSETTATLATAAAAHAKILAALDQKLDLLQARLDSLEKEVKGIEKQVDFLTTTQNTVLDELTKLKKKP